MSILSQQAATEGQVNYNGGLATDEGTPLAQIIAMSINTCLFTILASLIVMDYSKVPMWKKLSASSLTLPQFFGFGLWMHENIRETRQVYLYSLYLSYYPLMFIGFYEFANLIFAWLYYEDSEDHNALKLTGILISVFGTISMFLMLGFQDYNRF